MEKQSELENYREITEPTKIFLVRCPKCGNKQKKWTKKQFPIGLTKICVYCGNTFIIHKGGADSQIISRLQ